MMKTINTVEFRSSILVFLCFPSIIYTRVPPAAGRARHSCQAAAARVRRHVAPDAERPAAGTGKHHAYARARTRLPTEQLQLLLAVLLRGHPQLEAAESNQRQFQLVSFSPNQFR